MKNYIQPGHVVPVTTPAGGAVSGAGILVGALFGVACGDAAEGMPLEIATNGVFDLAKTGGAIAAGAKVYWDAAAKAATGTAGGNSLIGVALAGAAAGAVRTRLNGITV